MNLLKLFLLSLFLFTLQAKEQSLEPVTLQLPWKHQFEFAGFYAAKEKGFYADAGLDVTFVELNKHTNITDEVLSGDAQYGLTYSSIVAEYLNGKPLVLLANFFKQSPLVLITQPDIKTPADLKGKKVMGLSDSIHSITLLTMLDKFNIHLKDIENIPVSFKVDSFINKKIDAMSVFTTNELYTLDQKNVKYNIMDPVSYGAKYYESNLFTSNKELLEHPRRVKLFREASIKGWEYALSHQEEMVKVILKKYNTQNKSKEALLFEAKQIEQIMLAKVYKIGSIDIGRVKMIADSFIQAGYVKEGDYKDLSALVYNAVMEGEHLSLTKEEKKYLVEKKRLRICVDPSWMPFEKIEKGKYTGLAADYMKLIEKKIQVPFSLIKTDTWNKSLTLAKSRECDILPMLAKTDENEKYMDFTSSYVTAPLVLATKRGQRFIDDINTYIDKKWGVVKGYSIIAILKNRYPNIKIVEVNSVSEGLKRVENGTLFGQIGNSISISHAIQKDYFGSIAITGRLDDKVNFSIATRNDEKRLHEIMEKALFSIDQDVRQKVFNKWINIDYASKTDYTLVWQVAIVTLLIIIIIFYRSILLKKEVEKRRVAEEKLQKLTIGLSEKVRDATVDLEEKNLKLIESIYNFEEIFNTTMEMILIFDNDGTIIDINQSGLRMLGYYYKAEVVGSKISSHILESELPKVYENLCNDTREPYELILLKRDGTQLYALKSSRRIVRDGKKVRLATLMDFTELRQQNSHLIQQSKMAAMGEMIENIAHQWRQPLSQVNSAVLLVDGLLERKGVQDKSIEAKLMEIEELTRYMSTTISDFKDFFIDEKKRVSFVLSDTVNKAMGILNSSLKKNQIEIKLRVQADTILSGYPNELQQVVLVLINNAKDALISREISNPAITIDIEKRDENAIVTVCDNAGGIDEEIVHKVFEPYFTTKHQMQGTGLGLYISKMIIQESMRGTLDVQNKEEGACFSIVLKINS